MLHYIGNLDNEEYTSLTIEELCTIDSFIGSFMGNVFPLEINHFVHEVKYMIDRFTSDCVSLN